MAFHSFLISPTAVFPGCYTGFSPGKQNLALCLLFVIHEWVRGGKVRSGGSGLVLASLCFGLPTESSHLDLCQWGTNLSLEEIWRKVCIQYGQILTKFRIEVRKFFRAGVLHGFPWQKLPWSKQELEILKKKMMVNIVSPWLRYTCGNFNCMYVARVSAA